MMDDTMHKLASQLVECQDERKKIHETVERLREQLTGTERRHKTALDNAHEAGYRAGQQDAQRGAYIDNDSMAGRAVINGDTDE